MGFITYSDTTKTTHKSKKQSLIDLYEQIFMSYIKNKDLLSTEELSLLDKGITDIAIYCSNSILLKIKSSNFEDKFESKMATLYNKYISFNDDIFMFSFKFSEDLLDLAKDSIYQAIGIPDTKKAFKKKNKGDFVSYVQSILVYKVINFLNKEVNAIMGVSVNEEKIEPSTEKKAEIDELLERKRVKTVFGEIVFNEVREILINEEKIIPKNLEPILLYISKGE